MKNQITVVCEEIKNMLIEKNEAYGNSAAEPVRVFSKSDNLEQIRVRIDDKLSRIAKSGEGFDDEDTVLDLIGYLVLYRAVQRDKTPATYTKVKSWPPIYHPDPETREKAENSFDFDVLKKIPPGDIFDNIHCKIDKLVDVVAYMQHHSWGPLCSKIFAEGLHDLLQPPFVPAPSVPRRVESE